MLDERMQLRLTTEDLANVATVAAHIVQKTGRPFVSRTDCLRAALRQAAAALRSGNAKTD